MLLAAQRITHVQNVYHLAQCAKTVILKRTQRNARITRMQRPSGARYMYGILQFGTKTGTHNRGLLKKRTG